MIFYITIYTIYNTTAYDLSTFFRNCSALVRVQPTPLISYRPPRSQCVNAVLFAMKYLGITTFLQYALRFSRVDAPSPCLTLVAHAHYCGAHQA